ncbi:MULTISPECIES: sodium/proline symporter PutP [Pseudonocardia]|uniref:Sodium/proline symporter n=2 Tax=Pseudonocardia TaxID=1847 RepID=A0A1Y2N6L4_PSEAH|nr:MULTISPECIES: sodium/proline symporter PutP [Pseudonocardia]OSY42737.1 Sodium/proline symporter [Pseudonocardia autotrophica]TDN77314.1 sodium/proline symporter [Pseudonocardia autotrophica]BBG01336.1 sodium:proline symporter [Pseudonocardia autotrophica]GEC24392.1 sodium:proline symporter [Pseudonocardia saturnea]
MYDQTFQIVALVVYFALMMAIGYYAYRQTSDHEGYMLAGRKLPPWTAALSAGASDMSGWLMMGLPGAIYAAGLIEAWIAVGLTVGAYLNWRFVAPRLRSYTEVARNSITIPSFFENRLHDTSRSLRVASGAIVLVFFTFYVSSMMVAGGEFFQLAFGGSYLTGMLIVAVVTLAYTMIGGFLGASLTDVVQGTMMLLALLIVPVIAIFSVGGIGETTAAVTAVDPDRLSLLGGAALSGATVLGIISAAAWGLGYFGQPHIIVRFMAMRDAASAGPARRVGMSWMILSLLGAVTCGIVGIAFFRTTPNELDNPELVVLAMSQILLHPLVVGFVFAAVLAAIMSTVSSQLIVSSSAFVEDLYKVFGRDTSPRTLMILGRSCVLAVAVIAGVLALDPSGTILDLVAFAWAGFGASFGPAILLCLFWRKLTNWGALAGMVGGAVTVFVWDTYGPPIAGVELYEIVPGFLVNLLLAVVVSTLTYTPNAEIEREFDEAVAVAEGRDVTTAS